MVSLPAYLAGIDGSQEDESMFGDGPALWVNGKEILHVDADGQFDIRLTRQVIRAMKGRLAQDPRVGLRRSTSSDWIEVAVQAPEDDQLVLELTRLAVQAHRGAGGPTVAPPSGEALARRRRFH